MNIIGVNDTHDASCCYIKDGKLIYACAEERFQRRKNFGSFPIKSLRYLLKKYKLNSKYRFCSCSKFKITNNKCAWRK